MPNSYGAFTEKELHLFSLQAANELAEKAELIASERGWSYAQAAAYIRKMNPNLAEMEVKGYVSDKDYRSYTYTSYEASALIADKAKEKQREKKISYAEAVSNVYADPENAEIVRCFSEAD